MNKENNSDRKKVENMPHWMNWDRNSKAFVYVKRSAYQSINPDKFIFQAQISNNSVNCPKFFTDCDVFEHRESNLQSEF